VNLRIEAELLILIAQTGMNLTQAANLKLGRFSYQSHLNGYQVRRLYKNRRKGEVEFEIYSAYRDHFERYLAWCRELLPNDDTNRLFPFVVLRGEPIAHSRDFILVRRQCRQLGSPAGCLFCGHHRDIDSADHVWSLCSYRYLKSLEVARIRPCKADDPTEHPALAVMQRIDDKLRFFQASSTVRHYWVQEAHARVAEDEHHPRWDGFIALAELK
jgi:hypothetical protein